MEKDGHVEAQTSELLAQLADLRSAVQSASINMDTLEQQAHMIETQGRSIALLTPLLHLSNSSDILWFENNSRSLRSITEEVGFPDVEATMCSCLPTSAKTSQLRPVRVDYQCQGDRKRWQCMEINTSFYKSRFSHQELPASLSWWGLQVNGASLLH